MNDLTKDISTNQNQFDSSVKRSFSTNNHNIDNFNSSSNSMKFNLSNKYFERSLVLVKSQDYKGWFEKTSEISKKIFNNLGFYSKKAFKYILELSKSGNNFPDQEEKHIKSDQSANEIKDTVNKITQISIHDSNSHIHNQEESKPNFLNEFQNTKDTKSPESNLEINNSVLPTKDKTEQSQGATLNLAVDENPTKDTTTYDKIEKSILAKLQETGLNHYDIWLELGHFYQKYDEKEKAKEIFAMVMKHAQGRDKDQARDGLIALG